MKLKFLFSALLLITVFFAETKAQTSDSTSVSFLKNKSRFMMGGYGEAVFQRMFYSDNVQRYAYPESHKNESYGRFDLPHVVIYTAYDFGKGWKFSSEIEFEHGGSGGAYEIEKEETGEYEAELEKGGEVNLEQFWIEKTFSDRAHLRMGHIILPIGLTNQYHFPTEFFSVLRPEEESAILPCTWHQTGISFWGKTKSWRYEALFTSGLDAERFGNSSWIKDGAISPYEFEIANGYAGAFRLDNYSVPGLRMGLSGYFGYSALNSLKWERYKNNQIEGEVAIGAFDAVYNRNNIIARTNILYGHLFDSYAISTINKRFPSASPSPKTDVASDVLSYYVEAGYNVFSLFPKVKKSNEKLYVYAHYGFYDSMYKTAQNIDPKGWSKKTLISGGINYFPLNEIVVKAEYTFRKFDAPYNNEPAFSVGIAYSGMFF
jgi:hypothetical protein